MTITFALIIATTSLVFTLFHVYVLIQLCQRVVDIERKLANARVYISTNYVNTANANHTHGAHSARIDFN